MWTAIGEKDRRPKADGQALGIIRYSPKALRAGVDTYSHVLPSLQEEAARDFPAWLAGRA